MASALVASKIGWEAIRVNEPIQNYFKLHIIPPPKPLRWETPRTLLWDTVVHHLLPVTAPIGHFYIEIKSDTKNEFGVDHVLTGMSRAIKSEGPKQIIKYGVGLGTFFFDFNGHLDEANLAKKKLEECRKNNRLKTITIPVSPQKSAALLKDLGVWILAKAFQHYGGGMDVAHAQGSGCADFGAHFLNLSLGYEAMPQDWMRQVYLPFDLIGDSKKNKRVSLIRVFREGKAWAKNETEGRLYQTPDMDLTNAWLLKQNVRGPEYFAKDLFDLKKSVNETKSEEELMFKPDFRYGKLEANHQREIWDRIKA